MSFSKGILDSKLNIDELFQGSLDISCLNKTQTSLRSIQRFFAKNIKLRNVSKKTYWKRQSSQTNVCKI